MRENIIHKSEMLLLENKSGEAHDLIHGLIKYLRGQKSLPMNHIRSFVMQNTKTLGNKDKKRFVNKVNRYKKGVSLKKPKIKVSYTTL